MPHNFSTKFIKKLPEKVRKVGTTNYKFFMHLQEVELCDGFHLKSVVRNPKVLIRPHEKARQQRQTLIWWKPRPLAFHEVNLTAAQSYTSLDYRKQSRTAKVNIHFSVYRLVLGIYSFLLTSFSLLLWILRIVSDWF